MSIKWLNEELETGVAIVFPNYIQTNMMFASKFVDKYSALVGLDDETDQIALKPLSLDEDSDPKYKDSLRIKINVQKSFLRFGNTKAIKLIASTIHVDVPKTGLKGTSRWDDKQKVLFVELGGNK